LTCLTKKTNAMNSVFKSFGDFIAGLVGLFMSLLGLGIVAQVLLGEAMGAGMDVIGNIQGFVADFANGGFAGLVTLIVVLSLIKK